MRAAEVLRSRLRATDVLARQGGDEFVIMLRDITADDAMRMAEDLVGRSPARPGSRVPGSSARATASIGLVASAGVEHADPESLIMQADIAMYEVKDSGRNGARMYNPAESSDVSAGSTGTTGSGTRSTTTSSCSMPSRSSACGASGSRRFELSCGCGTATARSSGPNAFLPVAERHNLVQEIDHWVIQRAIEILAKAGREHAAAALRQPLRPVGGDLDLLRFISDELVRLNVAPESLVFEVTETCAIGNITRAQEFASSLSAIGCQMALDDFGAGFASFYYLKHIASSFVKIDGEFIRNLATDPTNRLLVKALADITHGMGKRTVAEHVEDIQALAMLDSYGVDFVQGKLLAHPKPVSEIDLESVPEIPRLPEPTGLTGATARTGGRAQLRRARQATSLRPKAGVALDARCSASALASAGSSPRTSWVRSRAAVRREVRTRAALMPCGVRLRSSWEIRPISRIRRTICSADGWETSSSRASFAWVGGLPS